MIVWTVLTGTRLIANELKICPPTWKAAMGNVPLKIARVGLRNLVVHPSSGRLHSQQSPATKKNWTMVKVTGKRKLLRITLPVFELRAEHEYHKMHNDTKRIVETCGIVNRGTAKGRGEGEREGVGALDR